MKVFLCKSDGVEGKLTIWAQPLRHRAPPSPTEPHRAPPNSTELHRTTPHRAPPSPTEVHRTSYLQRAPKSTALAIQNGTFHFKTQVSG